MLRSCARALSALRALHARAPTLHGRMRDERRAGRRTLSAGHRRVQVRCRHRVSAAPLSRASTARSCSCDCLSHGFPLRHVRRRETAELSDMQLGELSLSTATERRYTLCVALPLSSLALSSLALVQALASHGSGRAASCGSGRAVRRRGAALERSALAVCARDDIAMTELSGVQLGGLSLCAGRHRQQVRTQRRGRRTALLSRRALQAVVASGDMREKRVSERS